MGHCGGKRHAEVALSAHPLRRAPKPLVYRAVVAQPANRFACGHEGGARRHRYWHLSGHRAAEPVQAIGEGAALSELLHLVRIHGDVADVWLRAAAAVNVRVSPQQIPAPVYYQRGAARAGGEHRHHGYDPRKRAAA